MNFLTTKNIINKSLSVYNNGLISWHRFNENWGAGLCQNSSPEGRKWDASTIQAIKVDKGITRASFLFNGTSSLIETPLISTSNVSVCAWIKTTATGSGSYPGNCIWIHTRNNQGSSLFGLSMLTNKATIPWNDASSQNLTDQGTTIINDGSWHFLVAIRLGAIYKIYVDGKLESNVDHTASTPQDMFGNSIWPERIGCDYTSSKANNWNGNMADVMVYNRALTDSEVGLLYRQLSIIRPQKLKGIIISASSSPSVLNLASSLNAPTEKSDFLSSPSVLPLATSLQSPSEKSDFTSLPAILTATSSVIAPTEIIDYTNVPSVLNLVSSLGSPTEVIDFLVVPTVVSLASSIQNPTFKIDCIYVDNIQNAVSNIQSPLIKADYTNLASPLVLTSSVVLPQEIIDFLIIPTLLALASSVQNPNIRIDCIYVDSVKNVVSSLQSPLIKADYTNLPSTLVLASSVTLPQEIIDFLFTTSVLNAISQVQSPTEKIDVLMSSSTLILNSSLLSPLEKLDVTIFPSVQSLLMNLFIPTESSHSTHIISLTYIVKPLSNKHIEKVVRLNKVTEIEKTLNKDKFQYVRLIR